MYTKQEDWDKVEQDDKWYRFILIIILHFPIIIGLLLCQLKVLATLNMLSIEAVKL